MNDSCGCDSTAERDAETSPTENPNAGAWVSVFAVPKMDCPSEERMVRLALDGVEAVRGMTFDLPNRRVRIVHDGAVQPITDRLVPLGLGAKLQDTAAATPDETQATRAELAETAAQESQTLRWLLGINGLMFIIELTVGWWAQSAGLIADSLDMFADAAVYGLALYAVGKTARLKLRAAHVAGWLQLTLALGVMAEVARRFFLGSEPESLFMIGMACLALIANVSCLLLISRDRDSGVHMKASWIFSANDVIANLGVILAGVLVWWTGSGYPDLIIGTIIGLVVLSGARKILGLKA